MFMCLPNLMGIFAVIPAAVLLTVSFFVLLALRKVEVEGLKAFGYVVATLLWISAALVLLMGAYTLKTGRHPMMCMMKHMMKHEMKHEMKQGQEGQPMMHKGMMGEGECRPHKK